MGVFEYVYESRPKVLNARSKTSYLQLFLIGYARLFVLSISMTGKYIPIGTVYPVWYRYEIWFRFIFGFAILGYQFFFVKKNYIHVIVLTVTAVLWVILDRY